MKTELKQVLTARDIARRDGCRTSAEWRKRLAGRRGIHLSNVIAQGDGAEVAARIDHGRWIADCECGGAEYVDADDPVFFCFSCENQAHASQLRPVRFPPPGIRMKIEAGLRPETFFSWNEREEPDGL
jgi:hypothetical protein